MHNNALIMTLAASFIAIYIAYNAGDFTDNDIWFILATGREISENGIPYMNPFAMHDDMGIVVQQWLPCLLSYGLYSLGGFVALGIWCCLLSALVVVSLYRLGRLLKGDNCGGEWILLAIAVATPALATYISMRPHAYTMLAFCWLLFFMVKYRRNGKVGWLVASVALVAVHMNFQMSLAPFDLVVIACFAIPDILAPLHRRGWLEGIGLAHASGKHWPVLLCLIASAVALLATPYGIDGALYLVNSLGSASYKDFIKEMNFFTPLNFGVAGMCAMVMLVLSAMAIGKRGLKSIDLPLTLLAFGVGLAAFAHMRDIWLLAFFALPVIFSVMHGWSLSRIVCRRPIVFGITIAICAAGTITSAVLLWQAVPSWQNYEKDCDYTPAALLDYMEESGVDPQNVQLFNPFDVGGYLEWRGYKAFMDPRPELWSPVISGQETDYYKEYVDMVTNDDWTDQDYADFLAKYDFEYLIVKDGSKLSRYLAEFDTDYRSLMGTGDYTLWGKRKEG